jgi:hypothetical protein
MYTIYEIPGVKIGCDYAWPLRAKEQGVNAEDCVVLQQESDIIQASIDEIWWQIELDYPVDLVPYFQVVENNRKRASSGGKKGGPIGGKIAVESGQLASIRSRQSQSKAGKGKIWINDGIKNKRIYPNELEKYQQLGFFRGRIRNW